MDEKLKKRLAGAGVVLLLGFALVSLLPGPGEKTPPDIQQVTIPLQAEAEAPVAIPPSDQTTPPTLQAAPEPAEAALSPAEMEAAAGGDVDAPPEPAGKVPDQHKPEAPPAAPAPPAGRPVPAKTVASSKPATAEGPAPAAKAPVDKPSADSKSSAEKPAVANKPALAPAPPVLKAPAAPTGGNWFVQLGGYADIDNARQVQKQVQGRNLGCIIAPVDTNKGTIYRVRAGPFKDREQAQAAQTRLSAAGYAAAALVAP